MYTGILATTNNLMHWISENLKQSTSHCFHRPFLLPHWSLVCDHSGNTCRHHQWKQAETMVALATLALQSAKQLFQKGFGNQHMTCLCCLELTFSHRGWYWSLFQIKILQKSSILMTLVCEAVHYKNDWHNHIGIYNFFFCLPIFFWYIYIENYI